jgi:hypothetical protein
MQLSATLIDDAPLGHERADFVSFLLNSLWQFPAEQRQFTIGYVRSYFLIDE